jgi:hypothetical protein
VELEGLGTADKAKTSCFPRTVPFGVDVGMMPIKIRDAQI